MSTGKIALTLVSVGLVTLLSGCGTGLQRAAVTLPESGTVITVEHTLRAGARTPWDALRLAGYRFALPSSSMEIERGGRRGGVEPLVIIDGARAAGLHWLHEMHLSGIDRIAVLSALDATTRYGPAGAGGAIVIVTKR